MNDLNKELKARTFGYVSAALGLVAGLAWNEAIGELIDKVFPIAKDTVAVKFVYAIVVTIVVVILIKNLERIINRESQG